MPPLIDFERDLHEATIELAEALKQPGSAVPLLMRMAAARERYEMAVRALRSAQEGWEP